MIIEWFEDDGVQGGQRGITIDFNNNLISKWDGSEHTITEEDYDDIKYVIDSVINENKDKLLKLHSKLLLKERRSIKLPNGAYVLKTPLTTNQRNKVHERISELNNFVSELEIKLKELK